MKKHTAFIGTNKHNVGIVIRYPTQEDAKGMHQYINELSKEQTFIRFQGEQVTLEEETKFLKTQLDKIDQKRAAMLLVFYNNQLIGISGIEMKDKTESHEGVLGISLAKNHRGKGIGKLLMELILKEAEKQLPQLRIVTLGVFGNNHHATALYKAFGFQVHGRLPKGVLHKRKYIDHVYMYKVIKK